MILKIENHTQFFFSGSFVEIMFSLADTIDKMSNISFELDEKINKYKQSNKFCGTYIYYSDTMFA